MRIICSDKSCSAATMLRQEEVEEACSKGEIITCSRCKKPLPLPQAMQGYFDALPPAASPTTQKFEYLTTERLPTDRMNALGKFGWELVATSFSSVNGNGGPFEFYWKRPV